MVGISVGCSVSLLKGKDVFNTFHKQVCLQRVRGEVNQPFEASRDCESCIVERTLRYLVTTVEQSRR